MMRVLQLSQVLFIALSFGGFLKPTLAAEVDCSTAGDQVVKEGESKIINSLDFGEKDTINLFVKTESNFEGIRLNVYGSNGSHHAAWFPAEPNCFLEDGSLQQLQAWAKINKDNTSVVSIQFQIGKCMEGCEESIAQQSLKNLSVEAYGPSRWILGIPPSVCEISYLKSSSPLSTYTTCKDRPSAANGLSPIIIIVIVVVVLLFVAALVVVAIKVIRKN